MKKFFFLSFIIMCVCQMNAQTGAWSGNLEVQGTILPLVFHLDDAKPTMDSPAQGAKGIPVQLTRIETDSISINIPMIGASFTGKYNGAEIIGKFTQMGMAFPMVLHTGDAVLKRPQTPKPPFPYQQEEVSFSNGGAVLKGTLTLPESYNRKTPVVIMVTGSGLQNRDEEIAKHKPFAVIADALARNGIASLRYDDRGFAQSTGDAVNCTTEDLMLDALAGIDLLRQRFDKVGVLGHSEGGSIALLLGADKKADFIVSLAGMVILGKETLMDHNRLAFTRTHYPQEVAA
ncbi:MAG: lysophospholipase, partial [Muribaculaceae bacterium]|nr:lysophospholipase [Muribaculaceae bacterium]